MAAILSRPQWVKKKQGRGHLFKSIGIYISGLHAYVLQADSRRRHKAQHHPKILIYYDVVSQNYHGYLKIVPAHPLARPHCVNRYDALNTQRGESGAFPAIPLFGNQIRPFVGAQAGRQESAGPRDLLPSQCLLATICINHFLLVLHPSIVAGLSLAVVMAVVLGGNRSAV